MTGVQTCALPISDASPYLAYPDQSRGDVLSCEVAASSRSGLVDLCYDGQGLRRAGRPPPLHRCQARVCHWGATPSSPLGDALCRYALSDSQARGTRQVSSSLVNWRGSPSFHFASDLPLPSSSDFPSPSYGSSAHM